MSEPFHSTGRGGAGNIGHEPNVQYTDGGIVREGVAGESVDGVYSSGRGGAGNAVPSPRVGPTGRRLSHDKIPEQSLKSDPVEPVHYGRGGAANIVKPAVAGKETHPEGHKESVVDKVKHALHLDKKKDEPVTK